MNFNDYQMQSSKTSIYDDKYNITYPTLGLVNEAGEVAGKVKKVFRDNGGVFGLRERESIKKELGDVLWYMSALCNDLSINMSDVAESNLAKLNSRLSRGVIGGSGDER
jgi:NTP pyrophosphatase (non-canonical NTP hydrolase)|tara:strand:+ start:339 stop:665 length:327 start_codon:yes stop_codon:yes gene_type:complete